MSKYHPPDDNHSKEKEEENEEENEEKQKKYFRIISTDSSHHFLKWSEYFEEHLRHLYVIFIEIINRHRLLYNGYEFYPYNLFCRFFYNNSSKRIPRY